MVRTWVRVGEGMVGGVVREWGYSKLEARVKCGVMFGTGLGFELGSGLGIRSGSGLQGGGAGSCHVS